MKYTLEMLEALNQMGLTNLVFDTSNDNILAAFVDESHAYLHITEHFDWDERVSHIKEAMVWQPEGYDHLVISYVSPAQPAAPEAGE